MPRNLEIKLQLNSFKSIKQILNKNKIALKDILIQKDVYYTVKNGLLKLRIENGQSSLIYYLRNEISSKRWSDYEFVNFRNGSIEKFFARFMTTEVSVSKIRELYIFNNTRIHLDKVKGLGSFIELETIVKNGLQDAQKRFDKMINMLELDVDKQIRASYRDLLLKKKK